MTVWPLYRRLHPAVLIVAVMFIGAAAMAQGLLPNPSLTPGDAMVGVSASDVCTPGWSKKHRDVSSDVRASVFTAYGMPGGNHTLGCAGPHGCELDHLIPLELGGSNSPRNLWPQPYDGPMSAHAKDKLENRLHAMVCSGEISLQEAQRAIATDWVAAHRRFVER